MLKRFSKSLVCNEKFGFEFYIFYEWRHKESAFRPLWPKFHLGMVDGSTVFC